MSDALSALAVPSVVRASSAQGCQPLIERDERLATEAAAFVDGVIDGPYCPPGADAGALLQRPAPLLPGNRPSQLLRTGDSGAALSPAGGAPAGRAGRRDPCE